MSRHGGFRLFEAGDVFIFERVPPDDTTMVPLMFEEKVLQFQDRKSALKWLRLNGHKITGYQGKKFAVMRFLDSIQLSVEARVAVTILAQQRQGAAVEKPETAETPAKVETEVKA
jgi:hypothetical protein